LACAATGRAMAIGAINIRPIAVIRTDVLTIVFMKISLEGTRRIDRGLIRRNVSVTHPAGDGCSNQDRRSVRF
jgi:hypothetical protein